MFSHAIQKAFSTSLDGISTVDASEAFTMCNAYASHVSHPSQCVVVMNWDIPWMSQVLDFSPASKILAAPCSGTLICLYPFLDSFFKATELLVGFFLSTPRCTIVVVYENP